MTRYPLINVADVEPLGVGAKFDFKLPVTKRHGSSTAAFHTVFPPGAGLGKHLYRNCDEIAIHLTGTGLAGQNGERVAVRSGTCRVVPAGVEHSFVNTSETGDATVVGFFVGCPTLEDTGFEIHGEAPRDERAAAADKFSDGLMVHLDDVKPENMDEGDGWLISDFRLPISGRIGYGSTLFRARFMPGAVHKKHAHRHCEEIYFVISGHGLAGAGDDRVEVRSGDFHYIPAGVEHWLHNLSGTDPIEVVGIYINAASVEATGYTYLGDVTEADLAAART